MIQRITRFLTAPLALFLASITAPPSRADLTLYIANGGDENPGVLSVTPGGQVNSLSANFTDYGVAVDSGGHVFIDENSWVYEKGLNFNTINHWSNTGGWAMALDPTGNLFVSGSNNLYEITPGNPIATQVTDKYGDAFGMAIDSAGDIFVNNFGVVTELNRDLSVKTSFSTGVDSWGLAVSPIYNGDLFVANYGNVGDVAEINLSTGSVVKFTGFTSPRGLAFDSSGDLFVGDYNGSSSAIYEISAADVQNGVTNHHSAFFSGYGINQPDQLAIFEPQAPTAVPEPSSLALLSVALISLAAYGWWWQRLRPA